MYLNNSNGNTYFSAQVLVSLNCDGKVGGLSPSEMVQLTRLLRHLLILVLLDAFVLGGLWAASHLQTTVSDFLENKIQIEQELENPVLIAGFFSSIPVEQNHRIQTLIKLATALPNAQIIIAGGWRPNSTQKNGAAIMAQLLVANGIETSRVSFDAGSNDSVSNLENIVSSNAYDHARTLLLVSNTRHMLRLRLIAGRWNDDKNWIFVTGPSDNRLHYQIGELHYELAAWGSMLLPRSWFKGIIDLIRN